MICTAHTNTRFGGYALLAKEGLAYIASEKGNLEGAANIYTSLTNVKDNPLKDFHLWNLITANQLLNKTDELKKNCANFNENLKETFKN